MRIPTGHTSFLRLFFAIVCTLYLAGCSEPQVDSIRFGLANAPANLDPRFATDATSDRINRLLYARLVDFSDTFEPIPAIASWKQMGSKHFRFHLNPNRSSFHDGTPLTTRDIKATYDFILDTKNASPHRSSLNMIDHITIQDSETVDFHLNRPDLLFPSFLAIGILPAHLIQVDYPFHSQPVGSGPFAFVARPDETRLELIRLKDQQKFEFLRVQEPTVRALKLLAGEIDMVQNNLPPELVTYLAKNSRLQVQRNPETTFRM